MSQRNGNTQLNESREKVNNRIERLRGLGNTKRIQWNNRRRNRSI